MDHRRRLMQIRKNIQLELDMLNITDTLNNINRRPTLSSSTATEENRYSISRDSNGYGTSKFPYKTRSSSSSSSSPSSALTSTKSSNVLHVYEMSRKKSGNQNPVGRYNNWNNSHTQLANQVWCCLGDLLSFCNKYECKTIRATDTRSHNFIVSEVKALLSGVAPFGMTRRFPNNIRGNRDNMWICIGRSPTIEYQLGRIQSIFRRPLSTLNADKQRLARENFHLAIKEMLRDVPSAITDVRAYDRDTFEKEFRLQWTNDK